MQLRSSEGQQNLKVLQENDTSIEKGEQQRQDQQHTKEVENVAQNNAHQMQPENNQSSMMQTYAYPQYNYWMQNLGPQMPMQNATAPIQNQVPSHPQAVYSTPGICDPNTQKHAQNCQGLGTVSPNYIAPQATQSYIQPANIQNLPTYMQPYVLPTHSLPFINHGTNYAPAFHPGYSVQNMPLAQQPTDNIQQIPQYIPQTAYGTQNMPGYNTIMPEQVLRNTTTLYSQNMPSIPAAQIQNYVQPTQSVNQILQDTQSVQSNLQPAQVVQANSQVPQAAATCVQQTFAEIQPNANTEPLQAVHAIPARMHINQNNVPLMMPMQQTMPNGQIQQPVGQPTASTIQIQQPSMQQFVSANQQTVASRVVSTNQIQQPVMQQTVTASETHLPDLQQTVSLSQVQQPTTQHLPVQNAMQENLVNCKQQSNQNISRLSQAVPFSNTIIHNEQNSLPTNVSNNANNECLHCSRYRLDLNTIHNTNCAFL